MARKMHKFSEGGALGKYNRRMADIKKDFTKDSAGKSGRALEVLEAKRAQRIADAEDDRAKRMGTDRTATRAAERAAESNLTKTRKYGAAKSVTKDTAGPTGKITDTLGALTAPKSGLATAAKKPVQKPVQKPAAPQAKPKDRYYVSPENRKAIDAAAAKEPFSKFDKSAFDALKASRAASDARAAKARQVRGGSNSGADRDGTLKTGTGNGTSRLAKAADPKDTSAAASRARAGAALSYLNPFSYIKGVKRLDPSEVNKAKGGKVKKEKTMKYAKGGSTPPQPTAAERAADAKFRKSVKDLKVTPEQAAAIGRGNRSEASTAKPKKYAAGGVTKEMPSSKAMGSLNMAKGGKAKAKPAAKGKGKPFAATKFGAALMKKSADTKGRAMPKFAKGGSIDGCAVRGKTKAKRVTMACSGGKMGGRK